MERMIVVSRVGSDGILHLDLPVGVEEANAEVQITVEPANRRPMTANDLLQSGLIGIWEDRTDIGDSLEFARRLRRDAETARPNP
jgi:hypothetical protein